MDTHRILSTLGATYHVVVGTLLSGSIQAEVFEDPTGFEKALERHLDAILSKNLDAYMATLTASDDLMLIFPAGELIDSTEGVVNFHREWFGDANWVMEPEVIKTIEGSDQSTALLRYQYRDTPDGEPRSAWLLLVFQLEDGQWRLVHDQNTRIVPSEQD